MYEWKKQDIGRPYLIGISIIIVLLLFCWLYYDHNRNKPIHNDTDGTVERIENRLDDAGRRIDRIQAGNTKIKKTIGTVAVEINQGRENAEIVGRGITEAEQRIDNAIQISGRIRNRIDDIERANR